MLGLLKEFDERSGQPEADVIVAIGKIVHILLSCNT